MPEIATLGLKVDAAGFITQIGRAGTTLKKLSVEGEGVTGALTKLDAAQKRTERSARAMETAQKRAANVARQQAASDRGITRILEDRRRRAVSAAQLSGTEQVKAQVAAMEREFKFSMATLKEAQARGLMTPAEAGRRGRSAAIAYNQGVLSQIQRVGTAEGFGGTKGREGFTFLAGSLKNVDAASRSASGGIGRLNLTMASLLSQATATHPAVGQLTQVVGSLAIGSALMLGVLGGLAALALAYRGLTKDSRELRKAQDESIESLRELQRLQEIASRGPGGAIAGELANARARTQLLQDEIARLRAPGRGGVAGDIPAFLKADRLQVELDELLELVEAGERDITKALEEAAEERLRIAEREAEERLRIEREAARERTSLFNVATVQFARERDADAKVEVAGIKATQAAFDALVASRARGARIAAENAADAEKAEKERLKAIEKEIKAEKERIRLLREEVRQAEEYATSVIQVANAFGVLSDDSARALESVVQIGAAIARISAGDISAIPSLIGGIAQGIGLFGGGPSEAEQRAARLQEENNRILEQNTRALERLRELRVPAPTVAELEQAAQFFDFPGSFAIQEALDRIGLSLEEFARIVRATGQEILDSSDELIGRGLSKAAEALDLFIEDMKRIEAAFVDNLQVRRLMALGLDKEADALRLRLQHEKELQDAIARGFSEETIVALKEVQALEKVTAARNDELKAMNQFVTDFPRAMDIAFFEQKFGTFGTGRGPSELPPIPPPILPPILPPIISPVPPPIIPPVPPPILPPVRPPIFTGATTNWRVGTVNIVNESDDSGFDLLDKIESAALARRTRGGSIDLARVAESGF